MQRTILLSIDPGLEFGWAAWSWNRPVPLLLETGICKGTTRPRQTPCSPEPWVNRGVLAVDELFNQLAAKEYRVKVVAIELPSFFGTATGEAVAKRGDLVKLAWATGLLSSVLFQRCAACADLLLVPVNEWKGQMGKPLVTQRIANRRRERRWQIATTCPEPKSHAIDAVGIGLHVQGVPMALDLRSKR